MKRKKAKEKPYTPPFKYDPSGTMILDKNQMWSLDVRGWGSLNGNPHRMKEDEALKVQDAFGEKVCRILNEHWTDDEE